MMYVCIVKTVSISIIHSGQACDTLAMKNKHKCKILKRVLASYQFLFVFIVCVFFVCFSGFKFTLVHNI